jgi:hypothetical protein
LRHEWHAPLANCRSTNQDTTENFEAAVALDFAYYNLVKTHGAIRMTITITLIKDSCQKAENLGAIKYAPDVQGTSTLGFKQEISITGQSPLLITSSYDSVTGNISMAVFHGGKQYLMR